MAPIKNSPPENPTTKKKRALATRSTRTMRGLCLEDILLVCGRIFRFYIYTLTFTIFGEDDRWMDFSIMTKVCFLIKSRNFFSFWRPRRQCFLDLPPRELDQKSCFAYIVTNCAAFCYISDFVKSCSLHGNQSLWSRYLITIMFLCGETPQHVTNSR